MHNTACRVSNFFTDATFFFATSLLIPGRIELKNQNQIITKVAIVVAGADVTPTRLYDVEKDLIGQIANEGTFDDAANHAGEIEAMTDAYVTATYRQRLAKTLTKRALISATERAKEKQND